jgi:hypothetical protein
MGSQAITGSSFQVVPLHESAYELKISFSKGTDKSSKIFTFIQQPVVKEGVIFDVMTKNGQVGIPIQDFFNVTEYKEMENAAKQLTPVSLNEPRIAVLDIKDSHLQYSEHSIVERETQVCEFLRSDQATVNGLAGQVHAIVNQKLNIDFALQEGSLKRALVHQGGFTDQEIEYFYTRPGKIDFCQVAEFFMNGFKMGQEVKTGTNLFQSHPYITQISKRFESFQPRNRSVVFYPSLYKKMYSPDGDFAKVLSSVFTITGEYNKKNKITTLDFVRKV